MMTIQKELSYIGINILVSPICERISEESNKMIIKEGKMILRKNKAFDSLSQKLLTVGMISRYPSCTTDVE